MRCSVYLRLHNQFCLHASAVVVDDRAIMFCAPSGFGKSTTALAFASQGHAVLADDICVIEPQATEVWVKSGYPNLRLWKHPPSADGKSVSIQLIAPDRGKNTSILNEAKVFRLVMKTTQSAQSILSWAR